MDTLFTTYQQLLQTAFTIGWPITYLELIILFFNITCVYLITRNQIWNYPFALIGITGYMLFCYSMRFYSEYFLQIYFLITNIIGWFMWRERAEKTLHVRWAKHSHIAVMIGIWILGTLLLGSYINEVFASYVRYLILPVFNWISGEQLTYVHEAASFPYIDAFTTIGQILAMIFMIRRLIENWVIWIIINIVSIPMFYLKGGYGISLMFIVFLVLAIIGFFEWQKIYKASTTNRKGSSS